jgi:hypothetical protein
MGLRSSADSGDIGGVNSGTAGSMAKFSISNDHLFLINEESLVVYNITNPANPVEINKLDVDFGIETVFTLKGKLFIGSTGGVFIYDISNPDNILYLSHYEHITSCDPVVANDTLAFATLSSQNQCRWQTGANQLDVIDISNIVYPQNISSMWLDDPKGLAIDSNLVFVCNGSRGVKIFDFSNPLQLYQVSGIAGIDAYDIILQNKVMMLVGQDGLFQYDYSNINDIKLLSNILF